MVEAILVVQLTFPHHIAGALVLDMALAAAGRDDVAAFSEVGHGDQTDSGAEARDVEHVGDIWKLSRCMVPTPATCSCLPSRVRTRYAEGVMNILTDFRTEMSLMTWLEAPESKMKRGSRQAAPQIVII